MGRTGGIFLAERKAYKSANGQDFKVSLIDADGLREVFGPEYLGDYSGETTTLRKLYHTVSWMNRCVRIRANWLSNLPWEVVPLGADLDAEPLWDSETEPPDGYGWAVNFGQLIWSYMAAQLTEGAGYTFKQYTDGRLDLLRWWDPSTVEPIKDRSRGIIGFKRDVNGRDVTYDAELVCAVYAQDIYSELGPGVPVGEAARVHARAIRSLSGFAADYLDNGALHHTMLGVDQHMTPEQKADAESSWLRKLTGWSPNKKRVHIVNSNKVTPFKIGGDLSEISNDSLTTHERESICTAFDVPLSMASMTRSDGNAVEGDQISFLTGTTIPDGRNLQPQMNAQLFREQGLTFRFRPEKHELMQKSEVRKAQQVQILVGEPILTVDEGRELMGYEPLGGDSVSDEAARDAEMRSWKRKVKRQGRAVEFVPVALESWEAAIIRQRLDNGDDIDSVFDAV